MNFLFRQAICFLVVAVALAFGITARAQELARREMIPGRGFSLQIPEGFAVERKPEKVSLMASWADKHVTFDAREVEFDGELGVLAKAASDAMQKALPDFKLLQQRAFTMKSGLTGIQIDLEVRPSKDGPLVRQALYFFDGRPGRKCFITFGSFADDVPKFRPLWEKVMNSVVVSE